MVKVKLNEKYSNDFLTTTSGLVFYKKDNSLNKHVTILDINLNNIEHAQLLSQGTFVIIEDEPMQTVKTIKEDVPKNTIDNSLKIEKEVVSDRREPEPVFADDETPRDESEVEK